MKRIKYGIILLFSVFVFSGCSIYKQAEYRGLSEEVTIVIQTSISDEVVIIYIDKDAKLYKSVQSGYNHNAEYLSQHNFDFDLMITPDNYIDNLNSDEIKFIQKWINHKNDFYFRTPRQGIGLYVFNVYIDDYLVSRDVDNIGKGNIIRELHSIHKPTEDLIILLLPKIGEYRLWTH